jgi:hypothetical protein
VSQITCSGWPWTATLPISAFQVARITGVSHWHPAWSDFFVLLLIYSCFLYSSYHSFIRYINYKYFPHSISSFTFLIVFFDTKKFMFCWNPTSLFFILLPVPLVSYLWIHFQTWYKETFFLTFIVLNFIFKSFTYFQLSFVCSIRVQLLFFWMWIPTFLKHHLYLCLLILRMDSGPCSCWAGALHSSHAASPPFVEKTVLPTMKLFWHTCQR